MILNTVTVNNAHDQLGHRSIDRLQYYAVMQRRNEKFEIKISLILMKIETTRCPNEVMR